MSETELSFTQHEGVAVALLDEYAIRLQTPSGVPTKQQLQMAQAINDNLQSHIDRATRYLELWVDRQKACEHANEEWWLDELVIPPIETESAPVFQMCFTLHGDDGGWWTVSIRAFDFSANPLERGFRPFAFCRDQG